MTIIRKARVCTVAAPRQGSVTLDLVQTPEGWTYAVVETPGAPLRLTWRAKTPESATRKLQDIYDPHHWRLEVMA